MVIVAEPSDEPRVRLGRLVEERRKSLSLSIVRAATAAGIDRATWRGLEKGLRETEEYNYAAIERTIGWALGSIDDVLEGGEPTLQVPRALAAEPESKAPRIEDEAIIKVMESDRIPEGEKERIIQILIADREREQRRRLALAEDLMRGYEDEAI